MKIILATRGVYPLHNYGGMENYVYFLAKYLSLLGVDVEIVTTLPSSYKEKRFYRVKSDQGYYITCLPVKFRNYITSYHKFSRMLLRFLKNTKFDILHSFGFTPLYYLLPKRYPANVIVQMFALEPFFHPNFVKRGINYLFWYLPAYFILKNADLVLSESQDQSRILVDLFKVKPYKIHELPDGIEIEAIDQYLRNPIITRNQLNISPNEIVFISVNRLVKEKRVDWIIKAFYNFHKLTPHSRLIIIGEGKEEKKINKLISTFNLNTQILRFKNISPAMLFSLLALSDIYINASSQVSILISVLEAMACGLPILSVNSQGGIITNFENGLIVNDNIDSIFKGMVVLSNCETLNRMKINSKKMAYNYDWKKIALKVIDYYKLILKHKTMKENANPNY